MSYRALTDVLLGRNPAARAGDTLPDTYRDMTGAPVAVDFERLVAIGAAEQVQEPKRPSKEKKP